MGRRIRLTLRGWRSGKFNMRVGNPNQRTYAAWRDLIREAHRSGYFDVVDAIRDRVVSLPEAKKIHKESGLQGIREHLQLLEEESEDEVDFVTLLDEFITTQPRKASAKQHARIRRVCEFFLDFICAKHGIARRSDVPHKQWNRENLRAYVAWYISEKVEKRKESLEREWSAMDSPPSDRERDELLRIERGKKATTANRHVNGVGGFSTWLIERGILSESPAVGVRISTAEEQLHRQDTHRYLSPEEWKTVRRYSKELDREEPALPDEPDTLFYDWLVASGATTYTEGTRVRPRDVKMDRVKHGLVPVEIHGTKAAPRIRTVWIPRPVAVRLLARAERNGVGSRSPIFDFGETEGRKRWQKLKDLISERDPLAFQEVVDVTPICLRHTFAVQALLAGVDIFTLKRLMGHSRISTTAIYLKHMESPHEKLAKMGASMGLDEEDG